MCSPEWLVGLMKTARPLLPPQPPLPGSNWWEKKEKTSGLQETMLRSDERRSIGRKQRKKTVSTSENPLHPNYNFCRRPEDYISQYVRSPRGRTRVRCEVFLVRRCESQMCQIPAGCSLNFDHVAGVEYQECSSRSWAPKIGLMAPSTGQMPSEPENILSNQQHIIFFHSFYILYFFSEFWVIFQPFKLFDLYFCTIYIYIFIYFCKHFYIYIFRYIYIYF